MRKRWMRTIPEVAEMLDVSPATIYNWINAKDPKVHVEWEWRKVNGQQRKILRAGQYKRLEEQVRALPRDKTGGLRRGGEPGMYQPKTRQGWDRWESERQYDKMMNPEKYRSGS